MDQDLLNKSCKLLVIGGSAGSLEVLLRVFKDLHKPFNFPIVIVLHRGNQRDSMLSELLTLKTEWQIREIEDKDNLKPGSIFMVPVNYHLLFDSDGVLSLDVSEKVNYSRPSIDVTFESAAAMFGNGVAGLLLSGANTDGTKGLGAIKKAGGLTCAQDPLTAKVAYMPQSAIENNVVDLVVSIDKIAEFILSLNDFDQLIANKKT